MLKKEIKDQLARIDELCKQLRIGALSKKCQELVDYVRKNSLTEFVLVILVLEAALELRKANRRSCYTKRAGLSRPCDLDEFETPPNYGLDESRLCILRELDWVPESNVIVTGPRGVGKTALVKGLVTDAVTAGLKAYYLDGTTLKETMRDKDTDEKARQRYLYIKKCDLVVLDAPDSTLLDRTTSLELSALISSRDEDCSFIITSAVSPKAWGGVFCEESIAKAIVDTIYGNCEVINLTGESYRKTHHKGFFEELKKKKEQEASSEGSKDDMSITEDPDEGSQGTVG